MQTNLSDFIKDTPQGQEADAILRSCVHCGFCTATCPTYQLLGDELDGPRGRIYLIKQVLEGVAPTEKTQTHLDRCLTCRNCESTCPSGVKYGRLLDIGREVVDHKVPRGGGGVKRALLRKALGNRALFGSAVALGRIARPFLPSALKAKLAPKRAAGAWPTVEAAKHTRRMLILEGCVQPALAPAIDAATARILGRAGIKIERVCQVTCCGSLDQHLSAPDAALVLARRNIDAWWPMLIDGGGKAEAIVVTASGCTVQVKEYGHLLRNDTTYAAKASAVSKRTLDVSQAIHAAWPTLKPLLTPSNQKVAYHPPCTLQHGQQLRGQVELMLRDCGFTLTPVADSHLCCGSAGTYSILQPGLAAPLRDNKLKSLEAPSPDCIATSNIGCMTHLQSGTQRTVLHWVELVERQLKAS